MLVMPREASINQRSETDTPVHSCLGRRRIVPQMHAAPFVSRRPAEGGAVTRKHEHGARRASSVEVSHGSRRFVPRWIMPCAELFADDRCKPSSHLRRSLNTILYCPRQQSGRLRGAGSQSRTGSSSRDRNKATPPRVCLPDRWRKR